MTPLAAEASRPPAQRPEQGPPTAPDFWTRYREELERRTQADFGTGRAYDWAGFPADLCSHPAAPGPRMERSQIPARCDLTVKRMMEAMRNYAPSFASNPALKAAAKACGYTSAAVLRAELLKLEA